MIRISKLSLAMAVLLSLTFMVASAQSSLQQQYAGCGSGSASDQITTTWCAQLPTVIVALLLAFTIAALIFLVGSAIRNDRIRNFAIGELYEAIASTLIVATFFVVVGTTFNTIPNALVGTSNPYQVVGPLILKTISSAETAYSVAFSAYTAYAVGASIQRNVDSPADPNLGQATSLYRAASLPLALAAVSLPIEGNILVDGMYILTIEYYLMIFFSIAAIPAFIVPGIIFRAIFPTRALGGVLIAVGIGFYIVMPTLFAFAFSNVCQGANPGTTVCQLNVPSGIANLPIGSAEQVISGFWLTVLFYPSLIIAMTYAFIIQLASFIGASVNLSGRIRGKLI